MNTRIALTAALSFAAFLNTGISVAEEPEDEADVEEEVSRTVVAYDIYDLRLRLKVPQVFDNSNSTGRRKFVSQNIHGTFIVEWMDDGTSRFFVDSAVNKNFRVSGKRVGYGATISETMVCRRLNYIGSNLTGTFKIPAVSFGLELLPTYTPETIPTEDNSFYLVLSGRGSSSVKHGPRIATKFTGNVAGTQGCGCSFFGHVSPTRVGEIYGPGNVVDDVVPTYGTWKAKWRGRVYLK